ncbi:hypothetical protein N8T08_005194 [Aspergillus melleus]|uniref:Uncharacterized protein n=1 Tax=Aspergillus melleus TaxID=138277 RepID=A0ACC3BFQ2_9EURO|nr:hypothetical protein N8T08_005194 [Aspergillus melleus]
MGRAKKRPPANPYLDPPYEGLARRTCPICTDDFAPTRKYDSEFAESYHWDASHFGIYPAADMENMIFFRRRAWWTLYRMDIYDPATTNYHVSGVAKMELEIKVS